GQGAGSDGISSVDEGLAGGGGAPGALVRGRSLGGAVETGLRRRAPRRGLRRGPRAAGQHAGAAPPASRRRRAGRSPASPERPGPPRSGALGGPGRRRAGATALAATLGGTRRPPTAPGGRCGPPLALTVRRRGS